MKKKLLLILALVLLFVTGCQSTGEGGGGGERTGKKITFIVNQTLGDASFNDSAHAGLKKAKDEFGLDLQVIELGGDTTKQEPTLREVLQSDTDYIVFPSGGLEEFAFELAPDYPDKKIIIFDLDPFTEIPSDNILAITYKSNESSFLAGALAAKESRSGIIGFVAAQEMPILNDFLVGYISGALEANPDIKVALSYIGSWNDTAKAKELAIQQFNQGADYIHQVASGAGLGVLDAAKEKKFWAIGVDGDQAETFKDSDPEMAEQIITSALKDVGEALYVAFKEENDGTIKWGELKAVGMAEGISGIAKNDIYKKNVSQETQEFIEALQERVNKGEFKIPSVWDYSNSELQSLINSVRP